MTERIHAEMGVPEGGGNRLLARHGTLYEKGSREEESERTLKHTVVTPAIAAVCCALFIATIFFEAAFQHITEIRAGLAARRAASAATQLPGNPAPERVLPRVYDVFTLLPSWRAVREARSPRDWWGLLPQVKAIKAFQDALKENSATTKFLLPLAQELLARFGGAGNEKAYVGRDGWLFFRPEIDYVTDEGFLTPDQLRLRGRAGAEAIQPDPRKAILQFQKQLAERGIELIVVPVPSKAMVDPEEFTSRYDRSSPALQNPSFARFKSDLEAHGVGVFDITQALAERRAALGPQYLETDTHWRPETMEYAAGLLKDFIARRVRLPAAAPAGYRQAAEQATNLGDIAMMLRLPEGQELYRRQTVAIHPVLTARSEFWRPTRSADVLLLGDSYSNIYSFEAMGWGYDAGFAEQLSFALQRPLDRIVRNDSGAFATRQMLARELAQGRDRLAGKRLVIWEFADRELTVGDWKMIELKTPAEIAAARTRAERNNTFFVPSSSEALVTGTVESVSAAPRPGSVPYKDHILTLHLVDLEGVGAPVSGTQAVVYMWDMRDNKLTQAAYYRPGDRLTLRLRAWADVASQYEAINRSELDDPDLQLQEPCWGQEERSAK